MSLVRGFVEDGTGRLPVVWFNRPYLANQAGGEEYVLHGAVREGKGGLELLNPSCERADEAAQDGPIAPVYPAVGGVGPAALRKIFDAVLPQVDFAGIPETLPEELLHRYGLPPLGESLQALHRPRRGLRRPVDPVAPAARLRRALRVAAHAGPAAGAGEGGGEDAEIPDRHARAHGNPPFPLTAAQERVIGEILDDLASPHPMLRLLQGDVGSGKTIVAALALAAALESGYQGAFMAPTELLAEQHYANLERLLGDRYPMALLTGSAGGDRLRAGLASGEVRLVVGTHALIQETVEFERLGLAVIDEQHRFGVEQRALLRGKGERPDLLVMTATPIPRSLALTAYGDLPVSTLDEMPPGRSPVVTEVVPAKERREVYRRLREALEQGARAYVVAPFIEESEIAAASLAEVEERAREELADFPIAVLHGRVPAAERERTMRAFAAGEVRVLVATTVIEVGVDVPEATWMVIESAERFGLAQLHQLRGRVGRGAGAGGVRGGPRPALRGGAAAAGDLRRHRSTASRSPRPISPSAARATCWARGRPACRRCAPRACRTIGTGWCGPATTSASCSAAWTGRPCGRSRRRWRRARPSDRQHAAAPGRFRGRRTGATVGGRPARARGRGGGAGPRPGWGRGSEGALSAVRRARGLARGPPLPAPRGAGARVGWSAGGPGREGPGEADRAAPRSSPPCSR